MTKLSTSKLLFSFRTIPCEIFATDYYRFYGLLLKLIFKKKPFSYRKETAFVNYFDCILYTVGVFVVALFLEALIALETLLKLNCSFCAGLSL